MRSLNLNSSVNALVSLGNDRFCSVIRYALELVRSCFIPQTRQRASFQVWQTESQLRMQPVMVRSGPVAGRAVAATPVNAGGNLPTTG